MSDFGDAVLGGEKIDIRALETFRAWHGCVSVGCSDEVNSKSLEAATEKLRPMVHDNCKFSPPTYWKPWVGRDEFLVIISSVGEVFGQSFKYGRQWLSPDGRDWALEFSANIGSSGMRLDGIDLVKLDSDGKIIDFVVLARPPNAVEALKKEMMSRVPGRMAKMKVKQLGSKLFGL